MSRLQKFYKLAENVLKRAGNVQDEQAIISMFKPLIYALEMSGGGASFQMPLDVLKRMIANGRLSPNWVGDVQEAQHYLNMTLGTNVNITDTASVQNGVKTWVAKINATAPAVGLNEGAAWAKTPGFGTGLAEKNDPRNKGVARFPDVKPQQFGDERDWLFGGRK